MWGGLRRAVRPPSVAPMKQALPHHRATETQEQQFAWLVAALVLIAYMLLVHGGGAAADLMPIWLAGKAWAAGLTGALYAPDATVFTMTPPPEWPAMMQTEGYDIPLYPFVYPPIWAVLMAPVTEVMTYAGFDRLVSAINPALLVLTLRMAWRAAPLLPSTTHLALGMMLMVLTTVGLIPLMGNQVQVLVALLVVATMERSRADAPVAAGVLLALAAALKLYPAVFALLFIATRQWRALGAFVLVGGALALASVALAGWPPHAALLAQMRAIGNTAMLVNLSLSVDGLIAQLFFADAAQATSGAHLVVAKGATWALLSRLALIASFAVLIVTGWRRPEIARHPLFWPLAFLTYSLLGPLSWSFHYIAPLASAPLLLAIRGRNAIPGLIALTICLSFAILAIPAGLLKITYPLQLCGTLSLILLALAFATSLRKPA